MESKRSMVQSVTPPPFTPGTYRHYKGWEYEAIGVACQEADLSWLVVYKPLYPHEGMPDIWARPYADFMGQVQVDGQTLQRFTKID